MKQGTEAQYKRAVSIDHRLRAGGRAVGCGVVCVATEVVAEMDQIGHGMAELESHKQQQEQ